MILKYIDEENLYPIEFKKISKNVVEIIGDFPIQTKGFTLSRENHNDNWDYSEFTTVYKEAENGCQFSNDGSVYVEPQPLPEPEWTEEDVYVEPVPSIDERVTTLENEMIDTQIAMTEVYEMMLGM